METNRPDIYADFIDRLEPDEKTRLRATLNDPLYIRLMRIVESRMPSVMAPLAGAAQYKIDEHTQLRSTIRLAEVRGWELHKNAIFLALNEPPEIKASAEETFPEAGLVDQAWRQDVPFKPTPLPTGLKPRRK
jgi:hypothetical protein